MKLSAKGMPNQEQEQEQEHKQEHILNITKTSSH